MYDSRTDKAHSQNGTHLRSRAWFSRNPHGEWTKHGSRPITRAQVMKVEINDLMDTQDEQAIVEDGFDTPFVWPDWVEDDLNSWADDLYDNPFDDDYDEYAYDVPLADWERELLFGGCANGHSLVEFQLLPDGCKRMKCERECGHTEDLHPAIYGCENKRQIAAQRKEGTMPSTSTFIDAHPFLDIEEGIYQGVGEQVEVTVETPKRPPVSRTRIEFLLSKQQSLSATGNNPFSRPTEDIQLFDPSNRTRKGMKVG
jgi:hypothetical protein